MIHKKIGKHIGGSECFENEGSVVPMERRDEGRVIYVKGKVTECPCPVIPRLR